MVNRGQILRVWMLISDIISGYAQPGCLCGHSKPCEQSFWSRARNLQDNRPFLTASGVGTRSPTWTIAVS